MYGMSFQGGARRGGSTGTFGVQVASPNRGTSFQRSIAGKLVRSHSQQLHIPIRVNAHRGPSRVPSRLPTQTNSSLAARLLSFLGEAQGQGEGAPSLSFVRMPTWSSGEEVHVSSSSSKKKKHRDFWQIRRRRRRLAGDAGEGLGRGTEVKAGDYGHGGAGRGAVGREGLGERLRSGGAG